jgi:hypothetical protein
MHRIIALGEGLRGMFRALERRPLPDSLVSVVDQLDEPSVIPPVETKKAS